MKILNNIKHKRIIREFKNHLNNDCRSEEDVREIILHTTEFLWFIEVNFKKRRNIVTQGVIDKFFNYIDSRLTEKDGKPLKNSYKNKFIHAVLRFAEYYRGTRIGESGIYLKRYRKQSKEIDVLTKEEVKQFFDACGNNFIGVSNKFMLSMIYGCGLRKNELHQLNVEDFYLDKNIIHLKRTKNSQERYISIPEKTKEIIEEYFYNYRNQFVFNPYEKSALVSIKGSRLSRTGITCRIKALHRRITDLHKTVDAHLFRHSIGTHLMEFMSLDEIGQFLGHKDLDSTQIYTHLQKKLEWAKK